MITVKIFKKNGALDFAVDSPKSITINKDDEIVIDDGRYKYCYTLGFIKGIEFEKADDYSWDE